MNGTVSPGIGRSRAYPNLPQSLVDRLRRQFFRALNDLRKVKWEVGHLVGRDGKTPCRTALFMEKGDRFILNLNHQEITKLVALAQRDPNLAGHFANALCLTSDQHNTFLVRIPAERRESLVRADALCRCQARADTGPAAPLELPAPSTIPLASACRTFSAGLRRGNLSRSFALYAKHGIQCS